MTCCATASNNAENRDWRRVREVRGWFQPSSQGRAAILTSLVDQRGGRGWGESRSRRRCGRGSSGRGRAGRRCGRLLRRPGSRARRGIARWRSRVGCGRGRGGRGLRCGCRWRSGRRSRAIWLARSFIATGTSNPTSPVTSTHITAKSAKLALAPLAGTITFDEFPVDTAISNQYDDRGVVSEVTRTARHRIGGDRPGKQGTMPNAAVIRIAVTRKRATKNPQIYYSPVSVAPRPQVKSTAA